MFIPEFSCVIQKVQFKNLNLANLLLIFTSFRNFINYLCLGKSLKLGRGCGNILLCDDAAFSTHRSILKILIDLLRSFLDIGDRIKCDPF